MPRSRWLLCCLRTAGRRPRCAPGGNGTGDRQSGCPVGDFHSARSEMLWVQAHQWLDKNGASGLVLRHRH